MVRRNVRIVALELHRHVVRVHIARHMREVAAHLQVVGQLHHSVRLVDRHMVQLASTVDHLIACPLKHDGGRPIVVGIQRMHVTIHMDLSTIQPRQMLDRQVAAHIQVAVQNRAPARIEHHVAKLNMVRRNVRIVALELHRHVTCIDIAAQVVEVSPYIQILE